jgi:hypothetical protein
MTWQATEMSQMPPKCYKIHPQGWNNWSGLLRVRHEYPEARGTLGDEENSTITKLVQCLNHSKRYQCI